MRKADAETLKAFISRPVERFRPAYGRKEIIQPRQCVFIGTTNRNAYLRDETGARRFWPVTVRRPIHTHALARDRNQLLAEAVQLYRRGVPWWPDEDFERKHIVPQQEVRFETDVWEETITAFLNGKDSVLVGTIAREALGFEMARIGRSDQNRIIAVIGRLGWARLKRDWKGNQPWGPASNKG